ncbi:MAG: tetratricopeptide repeat protein, partial [Gemmataceae bacterium]|nr:tetratricopeptide repeat protein [Gemmataceae bacterium]
AALDEWADVTGPEEAGRLGRLAEAADDERGLVTRARQAVQAKDADGLKRLAREAAADPLPPPAVLARLALRLEAVSAWAEAEQMLRAGYLAHPNDLWVNIRLARAISSQRGRAAEAVPYARAGVALRPQSPATWTYLGMVLAQAERGVEGEEAARRVIALDPGRAVGHHLAGAALFHQGRWADAAAEFRAALDIEPSACTDANLGGVLVQLGRWEEAEAVLRRSLAADPEMGPALSSLGHVLSHQGRWAEAEAAYRKEVDLDPGNAAALTNLSACLGQQGRWTEAEEVCRQAIALDPADGDNYRNLGHALKEQGRPEEAVEAYRRAVDRDPKSAVDQNHLGRFLAERGAYREAIGPLRKARDLGKDKEPDIAREAAENLRRIERWVELDDKLAAVFAGTAEPATAQEWGKLAHFCLHEKKLAAAAARLFARAFAVTPPQFWEPYAIRYNAARAAALAGCGRSPDSPALDEAGRAGLRRQALGWLTLELDALSKVRDDPTMADRRKALRIWHTDRRLAGVRDPDGLARLPADERAGWEKLWADAGELRRKAEG